MISETLKILAF